MIWWIGFKKPMGLRVLVLHTQIHAHKPAGFRFCSIIKPTVSEVDPYSYPNIEKPIPIAIFTYGLRVLAWASSCLGAWRLAASTIWECFEFDVTRLQLAQSLQLCDSTRATESIQDRSTRTRAVPKRAVRKSRENVQWCIFKHPKLAVGPFLLPKNFTK